MNRIELFAPGPAQTASKKRVTPEEALRRDLGLLLDTWRGYARYYGHAERRLPPGREQQAAIAQRVALDASIEDLVAVLAGRKPVERPCRI